MVSTPASENTITAVHEAGHAWAYHQNELPLRYVTIRPRIAGHLGACRTWRPRPINAGAMAFIASAGPIAQAVHALDTDCADEFLEWDDYVDGAVLMGGEHDLEQSLGMLGDPRTTTMIRDRLRSDWSGVQALAATLLHAGTVSGRVAFALLSETAPR